jgi:hypothetical protein
VSAAAPVAIGVTVVIAIVLRLSVNGRTISRASIPPVRMMVMVVMVVMMMMVVIIILRDLRVLFRSLWSAP